MFFETQLDDQTWVLLDAESQVAFSKGGNEAAHADPRFSDFHEVSERWRIRPEGAQTRMEYNATLVPKFFVPPLIGPWVIKLRIRDSLLSGAETLETLARE